MKIENYEKVFYVDNKCYYPRMMKGKKIIIDYNDGIDKISSVEFLRAIRQTIRSTHNGIYMYKPADSSSVDYIFF